MSDTNQTWLIARTTPDVPGAMSETHHVEDYWVGDGWATLTENAVRYARREDAEKQWRRLTNLGIHGTFEARPFSQTVEGAAEFKDFGKIARWRTVNALVLEKVDGTNAQIYIPEDPDAPIRAGSRNQWITVEKDNAGFARFVQEHAEMFRRLGPGRHFGEWYGAGIQRRYGLDHKRFMIFNVDRFSGGLPGGFAETFGERVHLAPVLYRGPLDTAAISAAVEKLYTEGSVAVPGWKHPEGVIIQAAGSRWKLTDNGDAHKGQTTTHAEIVQAEAAKDRARREATETALDRALRKVTVIRRDDGLFTVAVTAPDSSVVGTVCAPERIGEVRRAIAQRLVDLEAP